MFAFNKGIIFEADELTGKPCWELATLVTKQKEGGKVVGILPGCVIGGWFWLLRREQSGITKGKQLMFSQLSRVFKQC
jgi:hypothetical protein